LFPLYAQLRHGQRAGRYSAAFVSMAAFTVEAAAIPAPGQALLAVHGDHTELAKHDAIHISHNPDHKSSIFSIHDQERKDAGLLWLFAPVHGIAIASALSFVSPRHVQSIGN
jgi:hypothetical protein